MIPAYIYHYLQKKEARTPLTEKMSITMSADAHTQLTNHINELGREVRELKKQNKGLTILKQEAESRSFCYEADIKELQKKIDDMESEVLDAQDSYALQKQTEQVYYHGEPLMCIEDGTPITISDVFPNKFIKENKKLKEEVVEVVQDINGKKLKVPSEEECQKQFGISKEVFIMLAQKSDCDYSDA